MKTLLTCCYLLALGNLLPAQQLLLEGFGAWNQTNYDLSGFSSRVRFWSYGGRLGIGADRFQIGGEYQANLSNPTSDAGNLTISFEENYYGGFVRTKISRYPALRFGLVLRAGAGLYNTTAVSDGAVGKVKIAYDPVLGMNGGFGFSIPTFNHTMLELGYAYHYIQRPELKNGSLLLLPKHNASYHQVTLGLSLNFVFGKRAEQYQHVKENWNYRNGWRG